MSLDLYLTRKRKNYIEASAEIFIENSDGSMIELKTLDDVRKYFPGAKKVGIVEHKTDELYWRNITGNLVRMAEKVKAGKYDLYKLLWEPKENGFDRVNQEYVDSIEDGYKYLVNNKDTLKKYEPSNGWGTYEHFLAAIDDFRKALQTVPYDVEDIWLGWSI